MPSVRIFHIAHVSVRTQGRNSFFDWLAVKVWIGTCIMVARTPHTEICHPCVPSVRIFYIAHVSLRSQGHNSLLDWLAIKVKLNCYYCFKWNNGCTKVRCQVCESFTSHVWVCACKVATHFWLIGSKSMNCDLYYGCMHTTHQDLSSLCAKCTNISCRTCEFALARSQLTLWLIGNKS